MGDLISKHDVLKLIENTPYDWSNITERIEMLRKIKALPSADVPDTNVGEWIFKGDNMFQCGDCGELYTTEQFMNLRNRDTDPYVPNFCPNCGSYNRKE